MRHLTICALICSLAILPGCASKYGEQKTQGAYYPACYRPIQDLRDNENNVNKNTGAGALLGAFTGAMVGLLATGKWQGAVMGGAIGGAGGAVAGNVYGKSQQERDDNRRLAGYLQNMNGDISNMDIASAAARSSLQCYDRQFQALLTDMRERKISRQAAAGRFAEIQSGREEAIAILGNAAEYGQNLNIQYENALASEEQQIQAGPPVQETARKQAALNTAKQKKQVLNRKSAELKEQKAAAQADSNRQISEINDAYNNLLDIRS